MTAIKTATSIPPNPKPFLSMESSNSGVCSPSTTMQEAKHRFASAISTGMDKLIRLGHGRERAAKQVLREIAGGCSPDEDETFKMMNSQDITRDDATTASTVSSAFRTALSTNGYNNIEAIDQLTSRLRLAKFAQHDETMRQTSTVQSKKESIRNYDLEAHPPASMPTRPSAQNLLGAKSRSPRAQTDKPHNKGKKRALTDKKDVTNEMKKTEDDVMKTKLSKEDEMKSKDSGRERRGKRSASLRGVDDGTAVKRVRSTSAI